MMHWAKLGWYWPSSLGDNWNLKNILSYISNGSAWIGYDIYNNRKSDTPMSTTLVAQWKNVCLACGRLWVRSPVGTDLSRYCKIASDSSTANLLGNSRECHGSSEMTISNGYPVSLQVWHAKQASLLNDLWSKFEAFHR